MLSENLRAFGLTDKEIKIYLTILKLGGGTASLIAEKAESNRPYCYEILESLKIKGLITSQIKSGTKYFFAVDPEKIKNILEEKSKKVLNAIPELKEMYNVSGDLPNVQVFEGLEGIKTILDDFIKEKKEMHIYASTEKLDKFLEHNFPNYIRRRAQAKIRAKVITEKSQVSLKLKKKDKKDLREMRFFPTKMEFGTWTTIYGDKIAIISLEKGFFGVIVENELISKTQNLIFDLLWSQAKKN